MSIIYLLSGHDKHKKFNKMPLKAAQLLLVVMILGQGDTSMAESLDADS